MKKKTANIVTGGIIAGAFLGVGSLNAGVTEMFKFNELGSGSEVRANLLDQSDNYLGAYLLELSCGEDSKKESKSKDAKCGEGKCGENDSTEMKSEAKADTTATQSDSKSQEAKCGEGKCGKE